MRGMDFELDHLLNPAAVFEHPRDVLNDPDLSREEKRAILSSWASDACAIEAAPALRKTPIGRIVSFDEVMDAMRALDKELLAAQVTHSKSAKTQSANRRRMGGPGDEGAPLH